MPYRTVTRSITPPEAGPIADEFRAAAHQVRGICGRSRQVGDTLNASWYGNARNVFFSHFETLPDELARYAESLDRWADQIANMRVQIEVQVWSDK